MMICFNCGQEAGDETEVCLNCGNRLTNGNFTEEKIGPPPTAKIESPKVSIVSKPAVNKNPASTSLEDKSHTTKKAAAKKTSSLKKKAAPKSETKKTDETLSAVSLLNLSVNDIVSREKSRARTILVFGVLLLVPGILLPWFYFFETRPLESFNLPVMFLFTGEPLFPGITAGLIISILFVVSFLSSVFKKSIITFAQFSAFIVFLLCIGGLLTNVRMWHAMEGLGGRYATFAYDQQSALPDTNIFAPVSTTDLSRTELPAGSSSKSGINFLIKTVGPGLLFPLLASFIILWSTIKYAPFFNSLNFSVPMTLTSILAVIFIFVFGLFVLSKAAPAWWYNNQAEAFTQLDRNSKAIEKLELCSELPIKSGICEVKLSRLYLQYGRKDEAKELLMKTVREIPYFPEARSSLGDMYFAEKEFSLAAIQYRKYLEYKPGDTKYKSKLSDALIIVSNNLYSQNNFSKALGGFKEAEDLLESNKKDLPLQFKIADSYFRLGMKKESAPHFRAISDLKDLDFEAHIQTARVYEEIEEFDIALKYYQKSIEAKPDNSFSYVYIGDLYLNKLNDKKKAIDWYRKAIEANLYHSGADSAREKLKELGAQ